ncbi:MAG: PatB family C-S lyase [Bacteroidales bacterium]|nr:PatB family C-S lyase [Bacteroidales bacterium]
MYNFDENIDRQNTNSIKYDLRKAIFGSENIIPMWVADMDFKTPDFIMKAIKKRTEHEILGYTTRNDSFYQSVIQWINKKHEWEIQKNWISFSPGVVPALSFSVLAFTKPGDKIIVQPPVYFPFFSSVQNNGRQLVYNELKNINGNYFFDIENLKNQIDSRVKMLFLCNPHNPVGRVWTKTELTEIANICVENDILIVSDEIHSDFIFKPNKHIPIASISDEIAEKTITTFAPSKTFNIAGLSSSIVIIKNKKLKETYDNLLNDLHLNNGNIFGNIALETAYNNGDEWLNQLLNYLEENIDFADNFIKNNIKKIKFKRPESTYLLWLDFRDFKLSDNQLNNFLVNKAKIGLSKGEMFGQGGNGFQRMNIACSKNILEKALNQLKKAIDNL